MCRDDCHEQRARCESCTEAVTTRAIGLVVATVAEPRGRDAAVAVVVEPNGALTMSLSHSIDVGTRPRAAADDATSASRAWPHGAKPFARSMSEDVS